MNLLMINDRPATHGKKVFRNTGFLSKDRVYHQVAQMGVIQ